MSVQRVAPRAWRAHRTIGAVVRASNGHGVPAVTVHAGDYTEHLVVNRPVRLVAAGEVRLIGVSGPALTVAADAGSTQGLRIEGEVLIQCGAMELEDCEIHGDVRVGGGAAPRLQRCRVTGGAVHLEDFSRAVVGECEVRDPTRVVVRDDAAPTIIRLRVIGSARDGIVFANAARAAVIDGEIRRPARAGVTVLGAAAPAIRGLTVPEPGGDGFRVDGQGDKGGRHRGRAGGRALRGGAGHWRTIWTCYPPVCRRRSWRTWLWPARRFPRGGRAPYGRHRSLAYRHRSAVRGDRDGRRRPVAVRRSARMGVLVGGQRVSQQPRGRGCWSGRRESPRLIQVSIGPDDEYVNR
jgi:hypothetical protein